MSDLASTLEFIALLLVAFTIAGCRVAQQYERSVIFRLGKFRGIRGPGLFWIIPMIEWQRLIDIRTITCDVGHQETITKDNVPVQVNAVIWYRIVDPENSVMAVESVQHAVISVAVTMLRNVIGQHSLDDVLKERDRISAELQVTIDKATETWGVKVEMVGMRNVEIPESMQRAMAQEAEALREKRARLIKAEAEHEAAQQLRAAAEVIMQNPAGLELRRMQMITEVGAEQNTTTIVMMPSEFVTMARGISALAEKAK